MKRVIVTGATGFVGSNLARRLLAEGHDLHVLVRPGYSAWRIAAIARHVHIHEVALGDAEHLCRVVRSIRPEWVFHLAAHGAYAAQTDVRQIMDTNVIGTMNLVQACLETGFAGFVNTGSSSEYGFKDHAPAEDESVEPNSHYAVAKAAATLFCRYTARSRGVHLPTLRLYSVYGPYEEPTRLMPTLISHGLKKMLPPLVNPDIARDYVYVNDAVDAYLLAITKIGQEAGAVYNVGTGVQTTLRAVVEVAKRELAIVQEPAWGSMDNRQWDTATWVANSQKARNALGWQPQYDFLSGFRTMVQWFVTNAELRQYYDTRITPGS